MLTKIKTILPKDAVGVDVGAYIGNHAIFFGIYCKEVHTFEPNRNIHPYLEANLANSPNVVVHKCALGAEMGEGDFVTPDRENEYISHVDFSDSMMRDVPVPVYPLDHFQLEPDFIKIDVEGAEIKVLQGAEETINNCHPELFVECREDEDFKNVFDYLMPFGYEPRDHYAFTPVWHFTYPG